MNELTGGRETPVLTNGPEMTVVVAEVVFTILEQQQREPVLSIPSAHILPPVTETARLLAGSSKDLVAFNLVA